MERCNSEDFREKDVINVSDGRRIGSVSEVEFNTCDGRLTAIVVPLGTGFFGMGCKDKVCIPWERIQCIGEDVILVDASGLLPPPPPPGKKKGR